MVVKTRQISLISVVNEKKYSDKHFFLHIYKYSYLVFVIWNTISTESFTTHMPNFKDSGTAISALGKTALMEIENIPSWNSKTLSDKILTLGWGLSYFVV